MYTVLCVAANKRAGFPSRTKYRTQAVSVGWLQLDLVKDWTALELQPARQPTGRPYRPTTYTVAKVLAYVHARIFVEKMSLFS